MIFLKRVGISRFGSEAVMNNRTDTSLLSVKIFGTDISTENNLSASDYYGVVVEVNFYK